MPDTVTQALAITDAEWKARVNLAAAFRLVDLYGWSDMPVLRRHRHQCQRL